MNGFGGFKENADVNDLNKDEKSEIGSEAQDKFDKLMGDDKIRDLSAEKQPSANAMTHIKEKFENLFTKNYESKTEIPDDYFDFDSNGTRKLSQLELVVFQEKLGISCEELNKKYRITSDGILVEQTQDISSEDGKETNDSNDSGNADNIGDFVEDNGDKEVESTNEQQENTSTELPDTPLEPNSKYEIDGETYETDDSGKVYKKNGELLPNTEYTINGNKYRTDENGNPVSCDSEPSYTEEGSRNLKEQRESGGEGRQEDDDGGHIIAKVLGGAEGAENLVPMRRTINRGDYKKMENEISKALQEGKKVTIHIDLEYNGDSSRPSKIKATYFIDGVKTEVTFDNDEKSTELLDNLNQKISDEDYESLKEELDDMNADGHPAAITSVKTEYDENGNPTKITVGVLDEATGIKSYKVYQPKGDE